MTAAEFARWTLEYKLVTDLLARVEQAEHAILSALRCPTDPVMIYDIVTGKVAAPWPADKTAPRRQRRALHAMHVLVQIRDTRRHLAFGSDNARLAAHAALLAGLYAGDSARNAVLAVEKAERDRKGRQGLRNKQHAEAQMIADAIDAKKRAMPRLSLPAIARSYLEKHDPGWHTRTDDERERKIAALLRRRNSARKRNPRQ